MNQNNSEKKCTMRKEYDFTKARKNPYAAQLKKQSLPARLRGAAPKARPELEINF